MRRTACLPMSSLFLTMSSLFLTLNTFFMANCSERCIPKMFVPKLNFLERKNWFHVNKYPTLANYIGKPETTDIFHTKQFFSDFLTQMNKFAGLRIYIASYSAEGSPLVP